jgi:hypothetical protein
VGDTISENLRVPAVPEVYIPYKEDPSFAFTVLVRTSQRIDQVVSPIRQEMFAVDDDFVISNSRTVENIVSSSTGSTEASSLIVSGKRTAVPADTTFGVLGRTS